MSKVYVLIASGLMIASIALAAFLALTAWWNFDLPTSESTPFFVKTHLLLIHCATAWFVRKKLVQQDHYLLGACWVYSAFIAVGFAYASLLAHHFQTPVF